MAHPSSVEASKNHEDVEGQGQVSFLHPTQDLPNSRSPTPTPELSVKAMRGFFTDEPGKRIALVSEKFICDYSADDVKVALIQLVHCQCHDMLLCQSWSPITPNIALPTRRLATSQILRPSSITLLGDGQLDALALRQGDPRLLASNDKDVGLTRGKGVVNGILDVHNVEASIVTLAMCDHANTAHVTTTSNHGNGTGVELDGVLDLACCQFDLDCVVDLDQWIRVTDATKSAGQHRDRTRSTYQPCEVPDLDGPRKPPLGCVSAAEQPSQQAVSAKIYQSSVQRLIDVSMRTSEAKLTSSHHA
jgi:hypothetical protein